MGIIADHVTKVKASEVSVVTATALELERAGRDIIRLSAGEPDFPTPDHIKLACIKALLDNKTKYPPVIGVPELREAICAKLKRDNALDFGDRAQYPSSSCSGPKVQARARGVLDRPVSRRSRRRSSSGHARPARRAPAA